MHLFIRKAVFVVCSLFLLLPAYAEGKDNMEIVVNIPSRTLELYQGGELIKEYQVAVGKPSSPTPVGTYQILNMEVNPVWISPHSPSIVVPSGPGNPLGYRWMEFYPTYGVHGTNAPWSIGQTVSNGCVRMEESTVEELFELVQCGTPVKVTYERLKISIDKNGQASIRVAPDVYHRQSVTIDEVFRILASYGISGAVNREFISETILASDNQPHIFAKVYHIKVNNEPLKAKAITLSDKVYVPVWAVAGALNQSIIWDETKRMVYAGKKSAEGIVKGDIIYVTEQSIPKLFGGKEEFDKGKSECSFDALTVLCQGKVTQLDVRQIDGKLSVPVLAIAELVGEKVVWNAANKVASVQGKSAQAAEVGERPYISVSDIPKLFNLKVKLNDEAHTLEILQQ
jgi:hypothetical protein